MPPSICSDIMLFPPERLTHPPPYSPQQDNYTSN